MHAARGMCGSSTKLNPRDVVGICCHVSREFQISDFFFVLGAIFGGLSFVSRSTRIILAEKKKSVSITPIRKQNTIKTY